MRVASVVGHLGGSSQLILGQFLVTADAEHPRVFEQRKIMNGLWRLLLDQFFQFVMGFNHYTDGYPGKFAELLAADRATRMEVWQSMLIDHHDFKAVESKKSPVWTKMVKRSWFQWTEVREMFEHDPPANQYSEALHENAKRFFAHQGDTVVVEKHFQTKSDQVRQSIKKHGLISTIVTLIGKHIV